ncbi:DUF4878 domain-containing protein [Segeticoccus rhizosphaerae]|jgi:hypothetical protein|uniref:DUF4878 domain-containing protein n=1 Tax=Segeticoccus rhizosphaerae TaxID=1104777 RepID=UPI0010C01108|nr:MULTISPECIES: DUF4878 domain-containing protein [Intrasporangiaceae]
MSTRTRTRAVTALAALLVAVPTLSACGGGDDGSEAAGVIESYFHAVGDKDSEAACKLQTTEDGSKPLKSDDTKFQECVKGMTMLMDQAKKEDLDTFKGIAVKEATVDGDKATVSPDQVEGLPEDAKGGDDKPVSLVKIDDAWYIDSSKSSVGG